MTNDDKGIRIVASRSDREIAAEKARVKRERAKSNLAWPYRELAANLLRVIRGAGRPEQLGEQMVGVLKAHEEYWDAVGHAPTGYDIQMAISLNSLSEDRRKHWDDWAYAIDTIASGSLQRVASQMVGQSTQESAGEREVMRGVTAIEKIRADNWRKANLRMKAAPAAQKRKPKSK